MRVGMNFRPFWIIKFRTMDNQADKKGLQITTGGDKRVTRLGRMLRKVKIDELPQLFNVVRGEMSLVGPRPEVEKYVELYKTDYEEILKIRPGITDISSIVFSNEEGVLQNQSDPEWYYKHVLLPEKIRLAKEYMNRASFFYDIKIILQTFYKVFYQVVAKLLPAASSAGE
jgi:lipopolysaccharide/colanic/teichoic acid biosynthesis glycosyltransferase